MSRARCQTGKFLLWLFQVQGYGIGLETESGLQKSETHSILIKTHTAYAISHLWVIIPERLIPVVLRSFAFQIFPMVSYYSLLLRVNSWPQLGFQQVHWLYGESQSRSKSNFLWIANTCSCYHESVFTVRTSLDFNLSWEPQCLRLPTNDWVPSLWCKWPQTKALEEKKWGKTLPLK